MNDDIVVYNSFVCSHLVWLDVSCYYQLLTSTITNLTIDVFIL